MENNITQNKKYSLLRFAIYIPLSFILAIAALISLPSSTNSYVMAIVFSGVIGLGLFFALYFKNSPIAKSNSLIKLLGIIVAIIVILIAFYIAILSQWRG